MMRSMSLVCTSLRPSNATSALAARLTTMSPRRPSTFRREQMSEISNCAVGLVAGWAAAQSHQGLYKGQNKGCPARRRTSCSPSEILMPLFMRARTSSIFF